VNPATRHFFRIFLPSFAAKKLDRMPRRTLVCYHLQLISIIMKGEDGARAWWLVGAKYLRNIMPGK
jgi:hypothetical protein